MPEEFDVVCLGDGVAIEAIAVGLQGSGRSSIHTGYTNGRAVGPAAEHASFSSFATFSDPEVTVGSFRKSSRGFPVEASASTSRR